MDSDPDVTKFIDGPWSDPVAHRAFVEARTTATYPPGQGYWTLRPRADPRQFLGWVLLIPLDGVGPDIEIGWRLPKAQWGRGYAPEAAAAVLKHGFGTGDFHCVVADIHPDNLSSQRVAEKLGFTFLEQRLHHGERHFRYVIDRGSSSARDEG
jgi:RimJ/RimL family protein N-acetyltransferase